MRCEYHTCTVTTAARNLLCRYVTAAAKLTNVWPAPTVSVVGLEMRFAETKSLSVLSTAVAGRYKFTSLAAPNLIAALSS